MSEQQDVIADLRDGGVLTGVRWAYLSATGRSLDTYSEADGHDATWLGNTRFTLFRDRLDRVFRCRRYAIHSGDDDVDLDLLHAELAKADVDSLPRVQPGAVRRSDLNGSPGWAFANYRFLLASGEYGKLDQLAWSQKSPTKQRVARQLNPEPPQPTLFDVSYEDAVAQLQAALAAEQSLGLRTFVVAHSLDPLSQQMELVLGRPRLNSGGGQAWHWWENLLGTPHADGCRRTDNTPKPTDPNSEPDAPVRLRRRAQESRDDRTAGER